MIYCDYEYDYIVWCLYLNYDMTNIYLLITGEPHPKPDDSKLVQSLKEQLTLQERDFEAKFKKEKQQLEREKQNLQRKVTDLQVSYTELQRDKDQLESELQGQIARLTVENMKLKRQHDHSSWKVSQYC